MLGIIILNSLLLLTIVFGVLYQYIIKLNEKEIELFEKEIKLLKSKTQLYKLANKFDIANDNDIHNA